MILDIKKAQKKVNELNELEILKYKYDIFKKEISIDLRDISDNKMINHSLVFHEVSSCYFVSAWEESRFMMRYPDEEDYLELTSIEILSGSLNISVHNENEGLVKQLKNCGNISLEIWSRILIIEAKRVSIDNIEFELPKCLSN